MPGDLQDLRVNDFTHALAGPLCAMWWPSGARYQDRAPDGDGFAGYGCVRRYHRRLRVVMLNVTRKQLYLKTKRERSRGALIAG